MQFLFVESYFSQKSKIQFENFKNLLIEPWQERRQRQLIVNLKAVTVIVWLTFDTMVKTMKRLGQCSC